MDDLKEHYRLWDEFREKWPVSRLAKMELHEYTSAGSKESFTYWIEKRLEDLGSIWGGSSFKFGVFSRKDTDDKKSNAKLSYSGSYGWYSSLGASVEEAFEKVRSYVTQVATMAENGDLDGIEAFEHLGEAFKWKIAFHYQNREAPVIVDIFKRAPLAAYVGGSASQSMAELQRAAISKCPENLGVLEYGKQLWEVWSKMNLEIWKLSHGNSPVFTDAERQQYLNDAWAVMDRNTNAPGPGDQQKGKQGKDFAEAPVGTLFYLCHGNSPQLVGQFLSEAIPCDKGPGWLKRKYRVLKQAQRKDRYTDNKKGWSPQGNSTFWKVGEDDLPDFESSLLKPYFATDLAELASLSGDPIDPIELETPPDLSDEEILKHFDTNAAFRENRATWSATEASLFCRLARAAHSVGLDWWHVGINTQVRFGRREAESERAFAVLGIVRGRRTKTVTLKGIGALPELHREPLTEEVVASLETSLVAERSAINTYCPLASARPGYWPDELGIEAPDEPETSMKAINRIYYGPPGTGKTYKLKQLLKAEYEQGLDTVSPDEWRRQFIAEHFANLKWWEVAAASLYALAGTTGKVKVNDLAAHEFVQALASKKGSQSVTPTLWRTLQNHTIEESTTVRMKVRLSPAIFDKTEDSYWQFAGDWQNDCAHIIELMERLKQGQESTGAIQRYSFVTFHQSYGYEEFVEGLRPILDNSDNTPGQVQYEIRPGVFKELCRRARLAPTQRFAIVIDEINRGNISKIFGELITLIETDKREGAENPISVILPYSGESFSVPSNVDVIGTMNTADRSLALLDTALRRRFDFEAIMPNVSDVPGAPLHNLRVRMGDKTIDVPRMLAAINARIEALYDRDHTIGHAYFTSLQSIQDELERFNALTEVFRNRILPLLEEYFFEDWQKIQLVLADNQKQTNARFVAQSADQESDLTWLFGTGHGLDSYTTKPRYQIQASAFSNPDAYIGIYVTLAD
ncbi:McrB family protein [Sulfuritalea hydrogenivorans]|uniref:ATPase dynein-related AAA domain-containing protein n=1 Tax=Sulfuritalea hydrogenivorans sk43H TaxID=1223802 RepID=W0SF34_9PROT|nr:AAA family ATPase [Sulfuritalea hydrogenivorans]BAO29671.1 hypothetical protein SUTH_01879 [Sulfuritalea hydrogenivorans sk43H]